MIRTILACSLLSFGPAAQAIDTLKIAQGVREWRQAHEQQIVDEFAELLKIPNVAADRPNIRRNAAHIVHLLQKRGLTAELLELEDANPLVFAERHVDDNAETVLVYIHYDGQPVNAADWASDPWSPVMRDAMVEAGGQEVPIQAPFDPDWRIFARSAGDDKAPVVALQSALLALDAAGLVPNVNLKVFLDGEEEAGSPNLRAMLEKAGFTQVRKQRLMLGAAQILFGVRS